jgi:hypothetical protein
MTFAFGVRRHDCALELGDMSPSGKAVTCHRTPNTHSPKLELFAGGACLSYVYA